MNCMLGVLQQLYDNDTSTPLMSRVIRGRVLMKPLLGDYRVVGLNATLTEAYTRTDYNLQERILHLPSLEGDIESLKKAGYVIPNKEEVLVSRYLLSEVGDALMPRPYVKEKKKMRKPKKKSDTRNSRPSHRLGSVAMKKDESLQAAIVRQRKLDVEFMKSINRIGLPALMLKYLKHKKQPMVYEHKRSPETGIENSSS